MKKNIFKLLILSVFIVCSACSNQQESRTARISGEDLLANNARGGTLSFSSVPTIKLFDASSIDLKLTELEELLFVEEPSDISKKEKNIKTIQVLIKESLHAELKVELMLSDEPLEKSLVLIAIESPTTQNCNIELWDTRGNSYGINSTLKLKEGTNYKLMELGELYSSQYLLLLKDQNGKSLMRRILLEQ